MAQEREHVESQEARVWGLRNDIIAKLQVRGGDPTRRFQEKGYELTRMASDKSSVGWESRVGWITSTFDVKRGRSTKFAMDGYPLEEKPAISQLLKEYANIEDDDFKAIEPRHLHASQLRPKSLSLSDHDFLTQYYHGLDEEKRRYVEDNKHRLLQGLIGSLEKTLQNL